MLLSDSWRVKLDSCTCRQACRDGTRCCTVPHSVSTCVTLDRILGTAVLVMAGVLQKQGLIGR